MKKIKDWSKMTLAIIGVGILSVVMCLGSIGIGSALKNNSNASNILTAPGITNLFNKDTSREGRYNQASSTAAYSTHNVFVSSDFIPIQVGKYYSYKTNTYGQLYLTCFDSAKNFIGMIDTYDNKWVDAERVGVNAMLPQHNKTDIYGKQFYQTDYSAGFVIYDSIVAYVVTTFCGPKYSVPELAQSLESMYVVEGMMPFLTPDSTGYINKKMVSVGDSLTSQGNSRWQNLVKNALWFGSHVNLGISGTTMTKMESYLLSEMSSDYRISQIKAENPDVVLIFGGTNDARIDGGAPLGNSDEFSKPLIEKDRMTFCGAYSYFIENLLEWKPELTIVPIIQFQTYYHTPNIPVTDQKPYADATREIAEHYSLSYADCWNEMGINEVSIDLMTNDKLHVAGRVGEDVLAGLVISALVKAPDSLQVLYKTIDELKDINNKLGEKIDELEGVNNEFSDELGIVKGQLEEIIKLVGENSYEDAIVKIGSMNLTIIAFQSVAGQNIVLQQRINDIAKLLGTTSANIEGRVDALNTANSQLTVAYNELLKTLDKSASEQAVALAKVNEQINIIKILEESLAAETAKLKSIEAELESIEASMSSTNKVDPFVIGLIIGLIILGCGIATMTGLYFIEKRKTV